MAGFEINHRGIDQMVREIKKSFEQASRRHQIRVPIGTDSSIGTRLEEDRYLSGALLWLDEQATEHPGRYSDMQEFADREELPRDEASGLALHLEQQGFVQIARSLADDTSLHLTDEGFVEVRRLKRIATDRVARSNYAGDALLRWLYDQEAAVAPDEFVETATSFFAGTSLTSTEIATAAAELVEHGLAEAFQTDTGSYRAQITPDGTNCVRSGNTVRSYMNSQNAAGNTNIYRDSTVVHGTVSGGVISTGDHNTINAGTGIDAQALASLVQGLRNVGPQLGLTPIDADDYEVEVAALERDGHDPEQGGRIWRRILRLAGPAFTTAVAAGAGQHLVALGTGLFS